MIFHIELMQCFPSQFHLSVLMRFMNVCWMNVTCTILLAQGEKKISIIFFLHMNEYD